MPVMIRDSHLEDQIEQERQFRRDTTVTRTTVALLRERLMQLSIERATSRPVPGISDSDRRN